MSREKGIDWKREGEREERRRAGERCLAITHVGGVKERVGSS